jgi:hypothetical protein
MFLRNPGSEGGRAGPPVADALRFLYAGIDLHYVIAKQQTKLVANLLEPFHWHTKGDFDSVIDGHIGSRLGVKFQYKSAPLQLCFHHAAVARVRLGIDFDVGPIEPRFTILRARLR